MTILKQYKATDLSREYIDQACTKNHNHLNSSSWKRRSGKIPWLQVLKLYGWCKVSIRNCFLITTPFISLRHQQDYLVTRYLVPFIISNPAKIRARTKKSITGYPAKTCICLDWQGAWSLQGWPRRGWSGCAPPDILLRAFWFSQRDSDYIWNFCLHIEHNASYTT